MERPVAIHTAPVTAPDIGQILDALSSRLSLTPPPRYARQLRPAFAALTELMTRLRGVGRTTPMKRVRLSDVVRQDRLPADVPPLFGLHAPDWYAVNIGPVMLSQHLVVTAVEQLTIARTPYDRVGVAVDPSGQHLSAYHHFTRDGSSSANCELVPGFGFVDSGDDTPDMHIIIKAVTEVWRGLNTIPPS